MKPGTLYGVGVGPGDPELVTVKGARLIAECPHLFVPKARIKSESVALRIVERYVSPNTKTHELVFPMVTDEAELSRKWEESAGAIAAVLREGQDACFVTLGDPLLYSTYIYLLRALKAVLPDVEVVTVPGVNAFSAVASITQFPVGEGKERVTIIPTSDDMQSVRAAIEGGGTVVLMKVGKKLPGVLVALEEMNVIDDAVFVAHAGMENQHIETNLRNLRNGNQQTGYLSTIIIRAGAGR